jgi:predicted MPP superfamily phosphohydrolase
MSTKDRKEQLARFEKACEEAEKTQQARKAMRKELARAPEALKLKLIADLKRVYEHPDNPFAGFAASRKRYRQLGHYPEILVVDAFGNHEEFLRAAGLADTRNTSRVRNKAALIHSAQKVADYADAELRRYNDLYRKTHRHDRLEVIVGSDFHSWFVDPFALRVFLDTISMVQPDVVVLNGDVFDFPQISRHRKLPGHFSLNLQDEIDYGREHILKAVRKAAPKAEILFVIGNHEYRLVNYLADTAPEFASLRTLKFGDLFGLDELEIGLVVRQNFLAPYDKQKKRELQENWVVIGNTLVATHGISCAKFAADEQLKRYQKSGTSGHTHRPQLITANSLGTGPLSWTSTPMMAGFAVGRDYVSEPSAWQMGFAEFSIDTRNRIAVPNLVIVHENYASFAGRAWRPNEAELARREEQWGRA